MLKDKDFYFLNKDSNPSNKIFIKNFNQLYSELKDEQLSFLGKISIENSKNNMALEVEVGFDKDSAIKEAKRCLNCDKFEE